MTGFYLSMGKVVLNGGFAANQDPPKTQNTDCHFERSEKS